MKLSISGVNATKEKLSNDKGKITGNFEPKPEALPEDYKKDRDPHSKSVDVVVDIKENV